ncbi:uncharacterized protein V1518DRAFT_411869 [Limtongia smithiae]|uniref:uncharacterized protein n=1 Tax=Limtongia smithiae TaxID=1125753 RepID=UPI0034CD33B6
MRAVHIILALMAFSVVCVMAWSEEDHEIFRINEELEAHEGKGTTFYSFMGLAEGPASSLEQITKAYRKRSRQLHPDKNPSKEATARFARLGIVANILRTEQKERYDFFLQRGFPRWKGTGYYYARFRPGLFTVLLFIYLLSSLAHYVILSITASSERARMDRRISECKASAWPSGFPPADGSSRRLQSPDGRVFVVHVDGSVWIVDNSSGTEYLLDVNAIEGATWKRTLLVRLPTWVWRASVGRFVKSGEEEVPELVEKQPKKKGGKKRSAVPVDEVTGESAGETKIVGEGKVIAAAASVAGSRRRRRK